MKRSPDTDSIPQDTKDQLFGAGMAVSVYFGFVLTGVVTTLLGPILPILSSQWSLTDGQAGQLFTAQFVGSMLGVFFTSWLLPKRGYSAVLWTGYLLMAAGVAGVALGAKLPGALSVFVYGVGQGATIPASNLLVSDLNPQRRASVLSLLNFAWGMGAVVCPWFIGFANRSGNLRGSLMTLAVMLAIVASFFWLSPSGSRRINDHPPSPRSWGAWRQAFALVLAPLFFLYVGTETALGGWVALHAKRMDTSSAGMWIMAPSLFWGFLLLGRALAPVFLRWLPEKKLVLLNLLLAGSGVLILLSAGSIVGVSVGSGVAGLGLSSVFPITIAMLSSLGSLASRAAGPMFALGSLGGAILPALVGLAATRSGSLRAALGLPLVAVLLMLALHGWNAIQQEASHSVAGSQT